MKDDFFNNLNLEQTLNPNSYLSSITLKDSSNNVIKTSILIDILFKRNTVNIILLFKFPIWTSLFRDINAIYY